MLVISAGVNVVAARDSATVVRAWTSSLDLMETGADRVLLLQPNEGSSILTTTVLLIDESWRKGCRELIDDPVQSRGLVNDICTSTTCLFTT